MTKRKIFLLAVLVCCAALAAADLAGLRVEEFTPSEIKEAVTGSGRADKEQIQRMMVMLLRITEPLRPDEADAIQADGFATAAEAFAAFDAEKK